MPIKKSPRKFVRKTERKTAYNLRVKKQIKKLVKEARQQIAAGKAKEAEAAIAKAAAGLDKAAQKNVIHRNKAARLKHRLYAAKKKIAKK